MTIVEDSTMKLGLGFGGGAEMGCSSRYDDDLDLSYIDKKLEDVLGHFRESFESEVSAKNLGPIFGAYGSFLPVYIRSPDRKRPRILQNMHSSNKPILQVEGLQTNSVVPSSASRLPSIASTSATVASSGPSKDSAKVFKRPLIFRIKVGPRITQKNAKIDNNLNGKTLESKGSRESLNPPKESPTKILQIMTSFPVKDNVLVSPLPHDLLSLSEKKKSQGKHESSLQVSDAKHSGRVMGSWHSKPGGICKVARTEGPTTGSQHVSVKEDWVCCDKCQKRRLIPLGTNLKDLPEKWRCSMLNWLPGMNQCSFSEEETYNALVVSQQLPAPSGGPSGSSISDASLFDQKKKGVKDDDSASTRRDVPLSYSGKNKLQASVRRCSSNGVKQSPLVPKTETGNFSNSGALDRQRCKLKEKKKLQEQKPSRGEIKRKREADLGRLSVSKKAKVDDDWMLDCDRPFGAEKESKSSMTDATLPDGTLKALKLSGRPENNQPISAHLDSSGNNVKDVYSQTPDLKDSTSQDGNIALKEGRILKHMADGMKKSGSDAEGTGFYIQAVLKFLHAASLLETCNGESAKSMEVYRDTAKLCEFCAQDNEKSGDFAAAALAYKLEEVAYMRVIYLSKNVASSDCRELQTVLQTVPLSDDSPSSAVSNVDNLNKPTTISKASLVNGVGSPQVIDIHNIAARNNLDLSRILNYAQVVNYAMESSRKCRAAFASATQGRKDLIKKVIDYTFYDVEALIRLVRLAID